MRSLASGTRMPKPVGVKDECPKGRDAPAARLATAALEEAHLETVSTGLLASVQAFDIPKSTAALPIDNNWCGNQIRPWALGRKNWLFTGSLRALLGSLKHPLILVDWSRIDAPGCAFLLRAAIPLAGRSFPIYERVHEREGCPRYQSRLIKTLAQLLPDGCIPILVTDAGFRRPWMKAVVAQGWYYVARIRNRELYRREESEWLPVKNLYALATSSPKSLGRVEMTRSAPHFIDLYCVRHSAKGRKHQRVTGSIAKSKFSRQSASREREPWLLASNLKQSEWNSAKIVAIYKPAYADRRRLPRCEK